MGGQKFIKNAKKGQFWRVFKKPEACSQTVLPDRSLLIGQELLKNAIFEKIQNETFWGFSNNVALVKNCPLVFYNAVADYGKMRHTRRKTLKKMRSIAEQSSHPDSKIMLQERRKRRWKKEEGDGQSIGKIIYRTSASCALPLAGDHYFPIKT